MIAEKILGNIKTEKVGAHIDYVGLDWFETEKKRLRKATSEGREIGIAVGEKLHDGDILYLDSKLCIAVKLTSCELTRIRVNGMKEMGRLCFEIGNRHLSLKITDSEVFIPFDFPTALHLENLGFDCEKIVGVMDDFIVCRAHGHAHSHENREKDL